MRDLLLLTFLVLVPLSSCRDAEAVSVTDLRAGMAGDSLRLTASFTLDPTIDSAAAVFTVKSVSKRVKLAPQATGATAKFPLPAEGETVTPTLALTAWKTGTSPVTVTRSTTYTQPVTPIVPPIINGFTADQAMLLLDSAPVIAYLTAMGSPVCHAEIRNYVSGTLFVPIERPACDSQVVRLAWYALMDSTGRGAAPAVTVGAWNAGQVTRGRNQSAANRAQWAGSTWAPERITVTDAACCPPLAHDWPEPDALAVRVSLWRGT